MNRWLGPGLMAGGAVLVVVAIIGFVASGDGEAEAATTSTAGSSDTSSTTSSSSTTTSSTTTSSTTTSSTTTSSTTTSSTTTSTTTTIPVETVEEFAAAYGAALAAGDVEFVWERLHPAVKEGYGEDLCRAWVEREVMQLMEYVLVSVNSGPLATQFALPTGAVTVADVYDVTVSFTFQGQPFTTDSGYAPVGVEMHWLGACQ